MRDSEKGSDEGGQVTLLRQDVQLGLGTVISLHSEWLLYFWSGWGTEA